MERSAPPLLTMRDRIAFSGKICSGKSTMADMIAKEFGHEKLSFATPLKNIAKLLRDGSLSEVYKYCVELWEDKDFARKFTAWLVNNVAAPRTIKFELKDDVGRKILQTLGDGGRNVFGKGLWTDLLFKRLKPERKYVIDDVRYPHEIEQLKEHGFVVIRLEVDEDVRLQRLRKLYGTVVQDRLTHPSETALDNYEGFTAVVKTNGNKDQQYDAVKSVLRRLGNK